MELPYAAGPTSLRTGHLGHLLPLARWVRQWTAPGTETPRSASPRARDLHALDRRPVLPLATPAVLLSSRLPRAVPIGRHLTRHRHTLRRRLSPRREPATA